MTSDDQVQTETSYPRYIRDAPADEDAFGSHGRIAKALASFIQSDPTGKVIGLLGRWGSGKSTIIKATEKSLSVDDKVVFFTFDAWQHQNDPARRSFLETLIRFLINKGLADKSKWEKELDILLGHVETTKTESTPQLTPSGKWIILTLALVPLGVSFLGVDTLEQAFGSDATNAGVLALLVGLFLSLLPLIAAGTLYLSWRPYRLFGTLGLKAIKCGEFWKNHRYPYTGQSIASLFMNKSVDKTQHVTSRRPEPTSIEFQQKFRELLSEADSDGYRFVFVIDNLDRVGDLDALQIWATIRSFFLGPAEIADSINTTQLPIIVLPIDPEAVERMFSEAAGTSAPALAQAFMDKTFDVTFDVSEPVMSDWRAYLQTQLRLSFHDLITDKEAYWITKIFEREHSYTGHKVTPRIINKFVNRLVSYKSQERTQPIDVLCTAYYCMASKRISDNIIKFLGSDENRHILNVENWQTQIAAVHFGVEIDKALQILLLDPLRQAIAAGDGQKYLELTKVDGFGSEFERLVGTLAVGANSGVDYTFVTNALVLLKDTDPLSHFWVIEVRRGLVHLCLSAPMEPDAPTDFELRLTTSLDQAPEDLQNNLITNSADRISAVLDGAPVSSPSIEAATKGARSLVRYCTDKGKAAPNFVLSRDVSEILRLLWRTANFDDVLAQIRTNLSPREVVQGLTDQLASPLDLPNLVPLLRLILDKDFQPLLGTQEPFAWAPLVDAALGAARDPGGNAEQAGVALNVLGLLQAKQELASNGLQQIVDEGVLPARIAEAFEARDEDCLSAVYALMLMKGAAPSPPPSTSWSTTLSQMSNLPSAIRLKLDEFAGPNIASLIWAAFKYAPDAQPLIEAIAHEMVTEGLGSLSVANTATQIAAYLGPLKQADRKLFLKRFSNYPGFWEAIPSIDDTGTFRLVVETLSECEDSLRIKAERLAVARLDSATVEDWQVAIESQGEPFALLSSFSKVIGLRWDEKSSLFSALEQRCQKSPLFSDKSLIKPWFDLSEYLKDKAQKLLHAKLAKKIMPSSYPSKVLTILKQGGSKFLKNVGYDDAEPIGIIFSRLAELRDGRAWLKDYADDLRKLAGAKDGQARTAFTNTLSRLERSKNPGRRDWAIKMKDILKV